MPLYNGLCTYCGEDFWALNHNRKYCSLKCSTTHYNLSNERNQSTTFVCPVCKKEFKKRNSIIKKHRKIGLKNHYCSKRCFGISQKGKKNPKLSIYLKKAYKEGKLKTKKFKNGWFRKDLNQYFRSSWEANYARVLNYLNIKWIYEPKVFVLNILGQEYSYLPDFYLPETNIYVEIKGFFHSEFERTKLQEFSKLYDLKIIEKEQYVNLYEKYKHLTNWEGKKYAKKYFYNR